jgi:hypothetical protein
VRKDRTASSLKQGALSSFGALAGLSMVLSSRSGGSMRGKLFVFLGIGVLALPLLTSCGSGLCLNQSGCPDGSWVTGSFVAFMASQMHRDRTTPQNTLAQELALGTAAVQSTYRQVPNITKDDEGSVGGSVTLALRPATPCGTTQITVAARIADCAAQNPTRSTWDGPTNGNAGQGVWKLVTYNSTHEVWRDERTTLLWSDTLGTTNWCRASGSSGGGPYGQVDPSNYCDNVANQNQVTPESWCTEDAGLSTPGTYDSMKGGMRLAATGTSPSVVWRLPTKWDFQQAEIDGIRFPLPNILVSFWSASVFSSTRDWAFAFRGDSGDFDYSGVIRSGGGRSVRCVGR